MLGIMKDRKVFLVNLFWDEFKGILSVGSGRVLVSVVIRYNCLIYLNPISFNFHHQISSNKLFTKKLTKLENEGVIR
jgi:hypothetical protein